jgi:hypothetical protein
MTNYIPKLEFRIGVMQTVENRVEAQAVSRRFTATGVWVRSQKKSCGIRGGQSGTGMGFLSVFSLSLSILILSSYYRCPTVSIRNAW